MDNSILKSHFPDAELFEKYAAARDMLREFNSLPYRDFKRKGEIIRSLFGGAKGGFRIEAPFCCDFGSNIFIGENVFINFNCTILDGDRVEIGDDTIIAPNVQIYATGHPVSPSGRWESVCGSKVLALETAPVCIGRNCWIGGGVIITPGVSIGENCVIGAGSVVTKDIPAGSLAVGTPCRRIRSV